MPVRSYKSQASIAFYPIHFISLTVPQVHGNRATDECRPACCQKKIEVILVSLFLRLFAWSAAERVPKGVVVPKVWFQRRAGGGRATRRRLPRRRRVRGGFKKTRR